MRSKIQFLLALPLILSSCTCCCNKDLEEQNLEMPAGDYEVRVGLTTPIPVVRGNMAYETISANSDIIEAKSGHYPGYSFNAIHIHGKQKGATLLHVKDIITKQEVTKKVRVTDFYITLKVINSLHKGFDEGTRIFLVRNKEKKFYAYSTNKEGYRTKVVEGRYEYSKEGLSKYISLYYHSDENDAPITAEGEPKEHKFRINASSEFMIERIKDNLNFTTEDLYYPKEIHALQMFGYKNAKSMTCILSQSSRLDYMPLEVLE